MIAPIWAFQDHEDIFSDEEHVSSLLQMQHRRIHNPPASNEVAILPSSGLLKYVGRYDSGDKEAIRFDAAGFEVQFQVTGATEVKVSLSQKISGPHGWFFDDGHSEEGFEDACFASSKASPPKANLLNGTYPLAYGLGMFPAGSQPHHFLVYVDGVPQRQPLEGKSPCQVCTFDTSDAVSGQVKQYTIARGLDSRKAHDIRIVKTSEPDFSTEPAAVPNWIDLHAVTLDQGSARLPDTSRNRRIEFIGDSWMSGYCNTCSGGMCNDGPMQGNSMAGNSPDTFRWGSYGIAWPHLLCEDLQAECHSTVLSGIGVHCTSHPFADPNGCSQDVTLPMYWQRTVASDPSSQWDFDEWTPEIVVMVVSSNEHFNDPVRDKEAVIRAYDDFLGIVYDTYPDVQVLLVCLDGNSLQLCESVKEIVAAKKESGVHVDLLDVFRIPERSAQKVCCSHPSEDYHKVIKSHVAESVRQIMGWSDSAP